MNPINIAIDIGTNYCLSAFYDSKYVVLIPFNNQECFLRSNITFSETTDDVLVGSLNNPNKNTVYDIKRLVGRQFNDLSFQKDMCNWTFTVENDNKGPLVKITRNEKDVYYTDQQLLTILFKHIKEVSDKFMNQNADYTTGVLIGIPSHFSSDQTTIFRKAAEDSNLKVHSLIREPVAACIGYQSILTKNAPEGLNDVYSLLFDCNAKSLNLSVVLFDQVKNMMIEKYWSTNYDICGDKLTKNLMDYFIRLYRNKTHNYYVNFQKNIKTQIRIACERMKCLLSENEKAILECQFLKDSGIDLELTRKEYDEINQMVMQETIKYINKFFDNNNIPPSLINFIILIGGSSKMPIFKEILSSQFPFSKVLNERNPDSVVVTGLALISDRPEYKPKLLKNSLSTDVGENEVFKILKKGSVLPCSNSATFATCENNQDFMILDVYKGESNVKKENELVMKFVYKGIKPAPAKEKKVVVYFDVDINEMLTVTAKEVGNNDEKATISSKIQLK